MKRVLAIFLAVLTVLLGAFYRVLFTRKHTLKDVINLEPEEVQEILIRNPFAPDTEWTTTNPEQIREILEFIYAFPIDGCLATSSDYTQRGIVTYGGRPHIEFVTEHGTVGHKFWPNMWPIRNIHFIGPEDYFTPLLKLVGREPFNADSETFRTVPNCMQEPFYSLFYKAP